MPLQSQQIVSMALQIAKCPGFTQQGGQFLNSLLQDLCENYDLDLALGTFTFNFNSATGQGAGPYNLPTDYLRTQVKDGKDEFFYTIQGVPYPLIQITKAEYDWLVQTPGFQSFPYNYATDLSQSPAQLFVWPPANGAYPCVLRYYRLMPDIVTPETSAIVPWFNNTQVLIRGTAGLLMQLTGDDRTAEFLGDDEERYPLGVGTILKKYLKNVEDREGAVHTVGKDRRRWGRPFDQLKNTKNIGWALAAMFLGAWLYFGAATPSYANCTAPCTKAQVTTDINTNWPDNTTQLITPALLRSTVLDLVNSYLDVNGTSSFVCPTHQFLTNIVTLSSYSCSQPAIADISGFVAGVLPIANGGTAQATAVTARQSSGLNVWGDQGTGYGDVNQTLANTDRFVYTTAVFTASRTWTLPAANVTGQPYAILVADMFPGVSSTQTLTVQRAGADTITGSGSAGTSVVSGASTIAWMFYSNGSNKWTAQTIGSGSTAGVTSVTPGGGLVSSTTTACSQTAITASGTLSGAECINAQTGTSYTFVDGDRDKFVTTSNAAAQAYTLPQAGAGTSFQSGWPVSVGNISTSAAGITTITPTTSTIWGVSALKLLPGQNARIVSDGTNYQVYGTMGAPLNNTLGADVLLNNTANYFDGPSVAQGTVGSWFAIGTVSFVDTAAAFINCKLWDGTTVIASGRSSIAAANDPNTMTLSGFLSSPVANIRMSCQDASTTAGKILFNGSGNSKDSFINVFRLP